MLLRPLHATSTTSTKITGAHVTQVAERRRELRPRDDAGPSPVHPEKPKPVLGINDAVTALRKAVEREPKSAQFALADLRECATRDYSPLTRDAPGSFHELVEIVGLLLGVPS